MCSRFSRDNGIIKDFFEEIGAPQEFQFEAALWPKPRVRSERGRFLWSCPTKPQRNSSVQKPVSLGVVCIHPWKANGWFRMEIFSRHTTCSSIEMQQPSLHGTGGGVRIRQAGVHSVCVVYGCSSSEINCCCDFCV